MTSIMILLIRVTNAIENYILTFFAERCCKTDLNMGRESNPQTSSFQYSGSLPTGPQGHPLQLFINVIFVRQVKLTVRNCWSQMFSNV